MTPQDAKREIRAEVILAILMLAGAFAVTGTLLMQLFAHQHDFMLSDIMPREMRVAQSQQGTPSVSPGKENGPAESMPGGTRPTTPAPEPARPDADAQKAGAAPALPPAPAEKIGEPIQR